MKKQLSGFLALVMLLGLFSNSALAYAAEGGEDDEPSVQTLEATAGRSRLNFNQGWKFKREYVPGADKADYSLELLKKWVNVDLPHAVRLETYSNGGPNGIYRGDAMYVKHFPLDASYEGKKLFLEFEGVMGVTNVWVNGTKMTTKLASETGTDTMYGGYLPFVLDITAVAKYDGTDNVVSVYANSANNGDVPPGKNFENLDFSYFGGIYRDVWLDVCDPVHITNANFENIVAGGGILVDYPAVSAQSATVTVQTHVRNETASTVTATVKTELKDAGNETVATQSVDKEIGGSADATVEQTLTVSNPKLWNLETPNMHTLVSTVTVGGVEVDRVETPVGIRKIEMHRDYGLKINGVVVPQALSGVNRHQEYPYVGYAASSSMQRRDAVKFKENDINVVRTGHYPPSKDFLSACNELGILIIEPTPGWQYYKAADPFKARVLNDIRQMVRRDRNEPCILAYETVLNETGSAPATFTQTMTKTAQEEHPSAKTATEAGVVAGKDEVSDIMYKESEKSSHAVGFTREYGDSYREQDGKANFFYRRVSRGPDTFYPGGEGAMVMQAIKRLVGNQEDTTYYHPKDGTSKNNGGEKGSLRSFLYQTELFEKGKTPDDASPAFIGSTSWIGIDHNRGYNTSMAACGLWDLYRIPKFSYYALASQRPATVNPYIAAIQTMDVETGPMVFISSYWTAKAPVLDKTNEAFNTIGTDAARTLIVYSNAAKVKLQVLAETDDAVQYTKEQAPMTGNNREWMPHAPFEFLEVPYTAGSYLLAVGYDVNGTEIARHEVHTAGAPAKLTLRADDEGIGMVADGSDQVMLIASVVDANGTVCDTATNKLTFSVTGDATIVGTGDPRVKSNPINTEAGIIGALLQAGKTAEAVTVKVEAEGLEPATLEVNIGAMIETPAPYTLIEYTGTPDDGSGYLAELSPTNTDEWSKSVWVPSKLVVTAASGEKYSQSLQVYNNMGVNYALDGKCNLFTGGVYVKPGTQTAQFTVLADGVTKYVSPAIAAGKMAQFSLDVSHCKTLRLEVRALGQDLKSTSDYVWLNPYIYEGSPTVDDSELFQNLALNKSATATSIVNNKGAELAVDGDVATLWIGDEVHDTASGMTLKPQDWTVDLGATYNVRNARLGLLHDSIHYTYQILTSPDNQTWTTQIENSKSSQASDILDLFTAQGVRYVRVHFSQVGEHSERDQFSNAAISEFEIFKDMGVASVDEYDLAGLTIENTDLLFKRGQTEYKLPLKGFETELVLRALPVDSAATVTVNGQALLAAESNVALSDTTPMTLTEDSLDEAHNIVIVVTTVSGKTKTYTIHVDGVLGDVTSSRAADAFVPNHNGAQGWYYEEQNKESGAISAATGKSTYVKNGDFFFGEDTTEKYLRPGPMYMHPGEAGHAVRTYVAPKAGKVHLSLKADFYKFENDGNDIILRVLKNGTKVWPTSDGHNLLKTTLDTGIYLDVAKDDRLQFVVDANAKNGGDATWLDTTVSYLDKLQPTGGEIKGVDSVKPGVAGTYQFSLSLSTAQGVTIEEESATWTLAAPYSGVSIDDTGLLTVTDTAASGAIVINAVPTRMPGLTIGKRVVVAPEAVNLALGKTATAQLDNGSDVAGKAVDGNLETKWGSGSGGTNITPWWMVDLGELYSVGEVSISFAWAAVHKFTLQSSLDNTTWTDIKDIELPQGASNGDAAGHITIPVNQTAQYLRVFNLTADKAGVHQYKEIAEFRAFATSTDITYPIAVVDNASRGTVLTSLGSAAKGDIVTVTATPNTHYTLNAITAYKTGETDTSVTITDSNTFTMPDYAVTVTAEFVAVPFAINYTLDGGVVSPANPATYTVESEPITLNNPTKAGYIFTGWTGTGISGTAMSVVIPTGSTGARTYTATWSDGSTPSYTPSSDSDTTTSTEKNDDGSTTRIVTDKRTGTVTETTVRPDGAKEVVVTQKDGTTTENVVQKDGSKSERITKPDGTKTESVTRADGVKSESATTADGQTTATVTLPKTTEGTITLPVEAVTATKSAEGATSITVKTDKPTTVVIPLKTPTTSTVAVLVNADGSERVLPKTSVSGQGLSAQLDGSATIKIIDNSKTFTDVTAEHWANDAVSFATSRELFQGTGEGVFSPSATMSRSMLVTVLWRLESSPGGATASFDDVAPGAWYKDAVAWGAEQKIVTGTGAGFAPDQAIDRASLATMLYRYARATGVEVVKGTEGAKIGLDAYGDKDAVSEWAVEAMTWAVGAGIIRGNGDGLLDPSGVATRAEAATILQRFVATLS